MDGALQYACGIQWAMPSDKEKNIPMAATLQEILLAPDTRQR